MCIGDVLFTPDVSRQLFEQGFGLLEVGGVKALGEPALRSALTPSRSHTSKAA